MIKKDYLKELIRHEQNQDWGSSAQAAGRSWIFIWSDPGYVAGYAMLEAGLCPDPRDAHVVNAQVKRKLACDPVRRAIRRSLASGLPGCASKAGLCSGRVRPG